MSPTEEKSKDNAKPFLDLSCLSLSQHQRSSTQLVSYRTPPPKENREPRHGDRLQNIYPVGIHRVLFCNMTNGDQTSQPVKRRVFACSYFCIVSCKDKLSQDIDIRRSFVSRKRYLQDKKQKSLSEALAQMEMFSFVLLPSCITVEKIEKSELQR